MKSILLMTALLCGLITGSLAQTGSLTGVVTNTKGTPESNISIHILQTGQETITGEQGIYHIGNIRSGTWTVGIHGMGIREQKKQVVITAGQITKTDFRVIPSTRRLSEVTINGARNKFANASSDYVAKLPLPNMKNPQVYNIVSAELMKEQMAVSYREALNNIPGAAATTVKGGNGGTYINMRGFYATAIFRDGLPVNTYAGIDPVDIERIEAIKGPSGALFGSTVSYGGFINRVTKKPYDSLGGEIGYSTGSDKLNRITLDLNTPLNKSKTALFRVNAALHRENSFQDYGFKHTYTIAPSFLFKLNNRLSLRFDAEAYHSDWISGYYFYMPSGVWKDVSDIPIGYKQSLAGNDLVNHITTFNAYTGLEYRISGNWKSQTLFTVMDNQWHDLNSFSLYRLKDNSFTRAFNEAGLTTFTTYDIQQNFTGDVNTGGVKNQLLIGLDYYSYKQNTGGTAEIIYDTISLPAKSIAPVSAKRVTELSAQTPYSVSVSSNYTLAAYVQDVIHFTDRITGMASLRADRFHSDPSTSNGEKIANTDYNQFALSPKFGLVCQPVKDKVSLFGSYMNGFVNHGPVQQPNGTIAVFDPEHARQWEGGIKLDILKHKVSGTISYYNIKVADKIRADAATGLSVQDGTQRNSGTDLSVTANPARGFNILAGYGYLDTRILKASGDVTGKQATLSPHNRANLWMSYQLPCGLGIGAGGNYAGQSFGDGLNTYIIPEYTVMNGTVFYQGEKYRLGLKVNNIGNTHYWDMNRYPQALRQFIVNFTYHF